MKNRENQDSSSLSSASSLPLFPSRRSRPGAPKIKDNRGGVNPPRIKAFAQQKPWDRQERGIVSPALRFGVSYTT